MWTYEITYNVPISDETICSDQETRNPKGEGRYASSCCSQGTAAASHRKPVWMVLTMGPPVIRAQEVEIGAETGSNASSKVLRSMRTGYEANTQSVSEPETADSVCVPAAVPSLSRTVGLRTQRILVFNFHGRTHRTTFISRGKLGHNQQRRAGHIQLSVQELVDHIIPPGCFSEMRNCLLRLPEPIQHQPGSAGGIGVASLESVSSMESKSCWKDTPQCYVKPLDSLKNWNNRFFWVDERVFPTPVAWRSSAPRDNKPTADSYSEADVATLNTHRTSFGQQPEDLLCLVGISRNYFFPEDQYPVFLYDNDHVMDLFGLIKNPNPKVKVGMRPRAAHEVPLLQATTSRVVNMEETPTISTSNGTSSAMEKSPLDFASEDVQTDVVGEHQTDNPVSTTVPQQE
ncbi:hypothetical protein Tco_0300620 [Tanacetum coccineum]